MTAARLAIGILTVAFLGGALGEAAGQAADNQGLTPAEIASTIARTIDANTSKAPGAPTAFESAASHDNIVELRYVVTDAAILSRLKSNVDQIRLTKASYYCNESRIASLKQGVVIHETIATSNDSDRLEFTFDISICDSLPKPKLADFKTLAEFALTVAKAENEELGKPSNSPLRLDGAMAREGVVEERFIVLDASAKASTQANRGKIAGLFAGYFCSKYRDLISQGLVLHHSFVLSDHSPVIDFTIDSSKC